MNTNPPSHKSVAWLLVLAILMMVLTLVCAATTSCTTKAYEFSSYHTDNPVKTLDSLSGVFGVPVPTTEHWTKLDNTLAESTGFELMIHTYVISQTGNRQYIYLFSMRPDTVGYKIVVRKELMK